MTKVMVWHNFCACIVNVRVNEGTTTTIRNSHCSAPCAMATFERIQKSSLKDRACRAAHSGRNLSNSTISCPHLETPCSRAPLSQENTAVGENGRRLRCHTQRQQSEQCTSCGRCVLAEESKEERRQLPANAFDVGENFPGVRRAIDRSTIVRRVGGRTNMAGNHVDRRPPQPIFDCSLRHRHCLPHRLSAFTRCTVRRSPPRPKIFAGQRVTIAAVQYSVAATLHSHQPFPFYCAYSE